MAERLAPLYFELHADQPAASGGKTGLIGSYRTKDNPVFQQLHKTYGSYSPNYSRDFRGGTLGAPKHGVSIIETSAGGAQLGNVDYQKAQAQKLYDSLMGVKNVAGGTRALHFYSGHNDLPDGHSETGTAGEQGYNAGVFSHLRTLAAENKNFNFYDPIKAEDGSKDTNWARAAAHYKEWQGGGAQPITPETEIDTDTVDTPDTDLHDHETPGLEDPDRPKAKEKAQHWMNLGPEGGYGDNRLDTALKGTQEDIVKSRQEAGELPADLGINWTKQNDE